MSGNKSLEPLFNEGRSPLAGGGGARVTAIEEVGAVSNRNAASVTATRQQITIGAGKSSIEFENSGGKVIHYGGSGVTSTNGLRIFPNAKKVFTKVKSDFSINVVCATGETSTLRIAEFE